MKILGVFAVMAFGAVLTIEYLDTSSRFTPREESEHWRVDAARVQRHLTEVEKVLRAADVTHLDTRQLANRRRNLDRLRRYRVDGVFPHNHDLPEGSAPYFEDEHGTLCAMAYLIAQSERRDLVDLVRDVDNNATVFELAEHPMLGPPLAEWLDRNGLMLAEAQLIQPSYPHSPTNPSPGCADACIETGYAVASAGIGAVNLAAVGFNTGLLGAEGTARWSAPLGFAFGAAGMVLGATKLDDAEGAAVLGIVNIVSGAVSAVLGVARLADIGDREGDIGTRAAPRVQPVFAEHRAGTRLGVRFRF